jgi:hypothetical protein
MLAVAAYSAGHEALLAARPALVSSASGRPLPVLRAFGGLAFLNTGSALKAKGITITNRLTLSCAAIVPPAHQACGLGPPSLTAQSGSLDPALGSGTVTATADLKFVRGSRSLAISAGEVSASHGVVTVSIKVGGREVSLGTIKPRVTRTVSDVTLANGPLMLTGSGAAALGHTLGTSLKAGGTIGRFGGNVVFTQANVVSGVTTMNLPTHVTATPTGAATGSSSAVSLPVLPGVVPLSKDLGSLDGTLHLSGGFTLGIGGRTVTLSSVSIDLHGSEATNRTDGLSASVNGHRVVLADMKVASSAASDNGRSETDDETSVTLTRAGAAALGSPFRAGSKFGTVQVLATVGP